MKRFTFLFLAILLVSPLFAEGKVDTSGITAVTVLGSAPDLVLALFNQQYPDITVHRLKAEAPTGETITMDTLMAAGTPPDIYNEFTGRAAKFKTPDFALPLQIDESLFVEDILDQGRGPDGKLYGIPLQIPGQAMLLNLDLLDSIGYQAPENWTISDFIEMAQKVRDSGYWPTVLFAANPSGDYLWVNWFGSFGAQFYSDRYARSTLDTPAGLRAFQWFDLLMKNRFVPPGPQNITDDNAIEFWQTGKVAAMPIRPSWPAVYLPQAVKSGMIEEPFRYVFVPFPRGEGVDSVPTIGAGNMIVVHKTADPARIKVLTDLAMFLASKESQTMGVAGEGVPSRKDVTGLSIYPGEAVVRGIAATAGWMDVGYAQPWYYEVRAALPEILREMYSGNLTPEEARDAFVAKTDEILAKY